MRTARQHILWPALVVLVAACAGGTPSTASATPVAGLSCSLPVYSWGQLKNGGNMTITGQNGFVSLPSGKFKPDPTLSQGGSYDWAFRRWLPVPPELVLADGSAYAYEKQLPTGEYEIHVVQVPSGADKVVYHMPYDNAYEVLTFKPEGIYVFPIWHRSGLPTGIWLLQANTHSLKPLPTSMTGTWETVAQGAVWGGPNGRAGDSLVRLDLATGALTTWFQHSVQGPMFEGSGLGVSLIGFDSGGRPLVEVFPPTDLTASPNPYGNRKSGS